jgi:hypothetical protein
MTAFVILGKLISGCFKTLFKDVLIPLKKSGGGFTSFSMPYNIPKDFILSSFPIN